MRYNAMRIWLYPPVIVASRFPFRKRHVPLAMFESWINHPLFSIHLLLLKNVGKSPSNPIESPAHLINIPIKSPADPSEIPWVPPIQLDVFVILLLHPDPSNSLSELLHFEQWSHHGLRGCLGHRTVLKIAGRYSYSWWHMGNIWGFPQNAGSPSEHGF